MITRSRLGVCLGSALASLACGGDGMGSGSGGASPGTGGSSATGGAASGGVSSSGGSGAGGAASTGGATNSTGGSATGTGGSSSGVEWDEVRCWQYQETEARYCYARFGNLWAAVTHLCTVEGEPHNPMDENSTACDSEDSSTPWDETWCDDLQCYGRLGDWLTVLRAPCEVPGGTPSSGTPSSLFCAGAVEAPVGWHDVQCLAAGGGLIEPYCYGFIGLYFPTSGLYPTCYIEGSFPGDPDYTELPADETVCL